MTTSHGVTQMRAKTIPTVMALGVLMGGVQLALASPVHGQAQTSLAALEMREGHREAAIARRADFMARMTLSARL